MTGAEPFLEVLLPVYNEGASIEKTIREIHDELAPAFPFRLIICEDGSVDDTKEVLRRLSETLPMKLLTGDERKGYSRAVLDGMKACTGSHLLCLDSDGQCDPKDFWQFWKSRNEADVVLGWRVHRKDSRMRLLMSGSLHVIHRLLFRVPVHDPSCPYVLIRRHVIEKIAGEMGEMQQGFWWEFVARVYRRGFSIKELPVHHRPRASGATQVYKLSKLPGIGCRHFLALFKIWQQTRT